MTVFYTPKCELRAVLELYFESQAMSKSVMPSFEQLQSALGQDWRIQDANAHVSPAKIVSVQPCRNTTQGHRVFALTIELPVGHQASQGTYRLTDPASSAWTIFMSSAAPSGAGQARLQAAFNFPHAVGAAQAATAY